MGIQTNPEPVSRARITVPVVLRCKYHITLPDYSGPSPTLQHCFLGKSPGWVRQGSVWVIYSVTRQITLFSRCNCVAHSAIQTVKILSFGSALWANSIPKRKFSPKLSISSQFWLFGANFFLVLNSPILHCQKIVFSLSDLHYGPHNCIQKIM